MNAQTIKCPSATKKRGRPKGTHPATKKFRAALTDIIEEAGPPLTARQVYYRAVVAGLGPKTEVTYRKVIRNLGAMREEGELPWAWIADNTRLVRQPRQYGGLREAIRDTARFYRRDFWRDQPIRLEVWVESDSIGSFIDQTTSDYGLPLFACKGQASKTILHAAAMTAADIGKPVHIIYIGDWDPSGLSIDRAVHERLDRYLDGEVTVELERIAITHNQVPELLDMAGPAKGRDTNLGAFITECEKHGLPPVTVEAEALHPEELRALTLKAITEHIDHDAWERLSSFETYERRALNSLAANVATILNKHEGGDR